MTYTYLASYTMYIKPGQEVVTIDTEKYGSSYTFMVQPEEVKVWSYTNSTSVIEPYNFYTITVNPKPFAYGFSELALEAETNQSEE